MFDHVGRSTGVRQGAAGIMILLVSILLQYAGHRIAALAVLAGGGVLLAVLMRIADARQNSTSQDWRVVQAVVESTRVAPFIGQLGLWRSGSYVAVLDYAYRTADGYFAGVHCRSFRKEAQAHALADLMKGRSISARYDPRAPGTSVVPESDLLAALPGATVLGKRVSRALVASD